MLKFRINHYATTKIFSEIIHKTEQAFNIVYFHGFTMHDVNYNLVAELLKLRFIELTTAISTTTTCSTITSVINNDMQNKVMNTHNKNSNNFITISLDYIMGSSLDETVQQLQQVLANRPTYIFAFSYGILNAQLIMDKLSQITPITFANIKLAHALHGSFIPCDENISIPLDTALATARLWSPKSLVSFGKLIGLPKLALLKLRTRSKDIPEATLLGQKCSLEYYNKQSDYYRSLMTRQDLMNKWYDLQIAMQDQIFPVANLELLAKIYNLQVIKVDGPHYIDPTTLINRIIQPSCYDTI